MKTKRNNFSLIITVIAMTFTMSVFAADAVDDELAKYYKAAEKIERTYQDGEVKERNKAVSNILATIKREGAKAEPTVIEELWKLVLEVDPENEGAKAYFTAAGTLASVTAALAKKTGPLIGHGKTTVVAVKKEAQRVDMSGAKAVRVTSSFNSGYTLGSFKAGTVLIFQYVSGTWSGQNPDAEEALNQSPDAADSAEGNRMQLFVDSGNEEKPLVLVEAGTAEKPFSYTLEEDVIGLSLRIANRRGIRLVGGGGANGRNQISSYTGEVKYLVRIVR